jgi:integrase
VYGAITITAQLGRSRQRTPNLKRPKSKASRRVVYLTLRARQALERQRELQQRDIDRWRADPRSQWGQQFNLVFASLYGGPIQHSNVSRAFKLLIRDAHLPLEAKPHWLRHTTGTTLAEEGMEVSGIAAVLGHADSSLTSRVYLHAHEDRRLEAARRLHRAGAAVDDALTAAAAPGCPGGAGNAT